MPTNRQRRIQKLKTFSKLRKFVRNKLGLLWLILFIYLLYFSHYLYILTENIPKSTNAWNIRNFKMYGDFALSKAKINLLR